MTKTETTLSTFKSLAIISTYSPLTASHDLLERTFSVCWTWRLPVVPIHGLRAMNAATCLGRT